ncbi:MAG: ABC transporter [Bacteroidetes bacterium]|nr:MAG: ABC transporter [Bacteroidota bacterium]
MSEEILKALMQLFAIIAKQDEGLGTSEREYVESFLRQQINDEDVETYLGLFDGFVAKGGKSGKEGAKKLTSVGDSVKILGICKKINRTLTQKQKVIVLVRLFELLNADRKFSDQRMEIITTVADVFKVSAEEYADIESFIRDSDPSEGDRPNILTVGARPSEREDDGSKRIETDPLDSPLYILRILSEDLYFLRYGGSENVFLNGLPIHNLRIYLFASGSSIKLPKGRPVYYADVVSHFMADMELTPISYVADHIWYRFPSGGVGLRDISFSEEHGKLVGIMGASGAGKTTLLNVLSGANAPSEGQVRINGYDLYKEAEQLEGTIGVIPQDDLLIEELTVYENLYYSAKLCFRDKSEEELRGMVEHTLSILGLLERKDLKVGSPLNKMISGGQRKRLNIALELIREPSILFVDEPTSGLSSRDSENVMDLLRELTLKGKLIFVVIHQPSSEIYKMFDDMIILDTGGYLIYRGNPVEAVMYFKREDQQINSDVGECPSCGNVNPELIFNIVESHVVDEYGRYTPHRKVSPPRWEEIYRGHNMNHPIEEESTPPPRSLNIPSRFRQFLIYTARDFRSKVSNRQYIALNLLETPVLAFILAYVIRYIPDPNSSVYVFRENENIPIYIFMALIVALFIGLTVSAEEIFKDRKILKREQYLNLSRTSYLLSKVFLLMCLSAIQSITFVLIANGILDLRGLNLEYWLILFSTAVCANLIGLNISATFNSAVTIYIVIPLLMIPMMVLSGAMFSFEKLNRAVGSFNRVPLIAEFMPTKWGYEALTVLQFKDNEFQKHFYQLEKEEHNANYKTVYYIPELQKRIEYCIANLPRREEESARDSLATDIAILRRAIAQEEELAGKQTYKYMARLNIDSIDEFALYEAVGYFEELDEHYSKIYQRANQKRDAIVSHLMTTNPKLYEAKRSAYHNESIADLCMKVFEKNKILQFKDELVQQYDPIYRDPIPRWWGDIRSHFLAPRKYFAGRYYDTYWFDLSIIWIMSLILYIMLHFEAVRRLGDLFGMLQGKMKERRPKVESKPEIKPQKEGKG